MHNTSCDKRISLPYKPIQLHITRTKLLTFIKNILQIVGPIEFHENHINGYTIQKINKKILKGTNKRYGVHCNIQEVMKSVVR